MSPNDVAAIATVVSAIFAIASAAVACIAVYVPWKNQHDNELFQEAILSLERAYLALSNNRQNVTPPLADRLNWLTAARHLEGYKSLKKRVKTKLYRSLCEEHEEFWRHQFYLCLDMHNIHHSAYYEQGYPPESKQPIEPKSALIIYCFATWPNEKPDPIDSVNIKSLLTTCNPFQGNIGLRTYIEKFSKILS